MSEVELSMELSIGTGLDDRSSSESSIVGRLHLYTNSGLNLL